MAAASAMYDHIRYTDADVVNKKPYIVRNHLWLRDVYVKDSSAVSSPTAVVLTLTLLQ